MREARSSNANGDLLELDGARGASGATRLDDGVILRQVKGRFEDAHIYSFVNRMLIALNPYEELGIYSAAQLAQYATLGDEDAPHPHVYAVAAAAFKGLVRGGSQSIVITGDSGAGKTETSKRVMQFLAHVAGADVGSALDRGGGVGGTPLTAGASAAGALHLRLLRANVLLEAFGNARTPINDNSSRFGKFVQVQYDTSARLLGAHVHVYLLEKARVSARTPGCGECTFHVLYLLLLGASREDARALGLVQHAEAYSYTALGAQSEELLAALALGAGAASRGDADGARAEWGRRLDAVRAELRSVGVSAVDAAALLRVCAALLHVGNVRFVESAGGGPDSGAALDESESVRDDGAEPSAIALREAARLLGVGGGALCDALASRCIRTGREWFVKRRAIGEAEALRDALARTLYARVFAAIVRCVNDAVGIGAHSGGGGGSAALSSGFIGILDIFGFEILGTNSLEQLLINYANERLQGLFTRIVFHAALAEAVAEGISTSHFDAPAVDNTPTLALLAAPHLGLIDLLNEECAFPNGTDETFVRKLCAANAHNDRLVVRQRAPIARTSGFVVAHYAGEVRYEVAGWLHKNRDPFSADVGALLRESTEPQVAALFSLPPVARIEAVRAAAADGGADGASSGQQRLVFRGAAKQFDAQLAQLMRALCASVVHFVRTVRPNDDKAPRVFHDELVKAQLRCGGVFEAVRVFAAGYPDRIPLHTFFFRFRCLAQPAHLAAVAAAASPRVPRAPPPRAIDRIDRALEALGAASHGDGLEGGDGSQRGGAPGGAALARDVRALLACLELDGSSFEIGRTKVFFKAAVLPALERRRDRLIAPTAIVLQAVARGMAARRRYAPMVEEARVHAQLQRQAERSLLALAEAEAEAERQREAEAAAAAARADAQRAEAERAAIVLAHAAAVQQRADAESGARLVEARARIADLEAQLAAAIADAAEQRARRLDAEAALGAATGGADGAAAAAVERATTAGAEAEAMAMAMARAAREQAARAARAEAEAAELRAQLGALRDESASALAAANAQAADARAAAATWEAEAAAEAAERKRSQALREAERAAAEDAARELANERDLWRAEAFAGDHPADGEAGGPARLSARRPLVLPPDALGARGAEGSGRCPPAEAARAPPSRGAFHAPRVGADVGGGSAGSGALLSERRSFAAAAPFPLSRASSSVHRDINPALRQHWTPTAIAGLGAAPAYGAMRLRETPNKRTSAVIGGALAWPGAARGAHSRTGSFGRPASARSDASSKSTYDADLLAYAQYMGIDPAVESALMWIAESLREAPLPDGWQLQRDPRGNLYFFDETTGEASLQHPLDLQFKALLQEHRIETAVSGKAGGPRPAPPAAGGASEGGRCSHVDAFAAVTLSATDALLLTPGPENLVRNALHTPQRARALASGSGDVLLGAAGVGAADGSPLLPTYNLVAVVAGGADGEPADELPLLRASLVQGGISDGNGGVLFELFAQLGGGCEMGVVIGNAACARSTLYIPPRNGELLERELSAVTIREIGGGAAELEAVIPQPSADAIAVGVDVRRRGGALLAAHERGRSAVSRELIVLTGRIQASARSVHVKLSLPTGGAAGGGVGSSAQAGPQSLPNLVMTMRQMAGGAMEMLYRDRIAPLQAMHIALALARWWSVRHAGRLSSAVL